MNDTREMGPPLADLDKSMLTTAELCALIQKSADTVTRYLQLGLMPAPAIRRGGYRWDRRVINEWIAAGCPTVAEMDAARRERERGQRKPR